MATAHEGLFLKNIRYYATYQAICVVFSIILSSIGAFFHFLLNHEISIVEGWLHNNQWEILITAKLIALFLLNRWFSMRLYQLKTIRQLFKELVHWPEPKAVVVAAFMIASYLSLGKVVFVGQNVGYWYFHFVSYLSIFLYFGIEFVVIAYLDDVLNQKGDVSRVWLGVIYTALFAVAFRIIVPDYYGLLSYVVVSYLTLIYLSGKAFRDWSNVLCFLIIFVAPMAAFFGMDPVWGDDFSPFRIEKKLSVTFLAVIWVVSFLYYKYRDEFIVSVRKLLR